MREAQRSASQILDWVGLGDREDHTIDQLSGGEQQRVALARALISKPDLLLADEPTGNLDHLAGEQVLALFRRAADQNGQTIIMVTHDPGAASYADRVIFLADGCVVSELHSEPLSVDLIARHQAALQT